MEKEHGVQWWLWQYDRGELAGEWESAGDKLSVRRNPGFNF